MKDGGAGRAIARRALVLTALVALAAVALLFMTTGAYAEDALSDYDAGHVALINRIIEYNGLNATKDKPDHWSFATWNSAKPKRLTKLSLHDRELTGSLDLSGCATLTSLVCDDNELTDLNVSGCAALTSLNGNMNQLKAIDLTGCVNLTELTCDDNELERLDLSMCTKLKVLDCGANGLQELDTLNCRSTLKQFVGMDNALSALNLENYAALETVWIDRNNLTTLNVRGCAKLTALDCDNNDLTALDVSGCANLEKLGVASNPLSALDLSKNAKLNMLICFGTAIKHLDLSGLSKLHELCLGEDLTESFLESLDLTGCTGLKIVECFNNKLTNLVLTGCKNLEFLDCSTNRLSSLALTDCAKLTDLDCSGNQFKKIDIAGAVKLDELDCSDNPLTTLDLSARNTITELYCVDCPTLTKMDLTGCVNLSILYCYQNALTSIDLTGLKGLTVLSCGVNQLSALDVTPFPKLHFLSCFANKLESLDVSKNPILSSLYCYDNDLTELVLNNHRALVNLDCSGNQLAALDVSGSLKIEELRCQDNPLYSLVLPGSGANRLTVTPSEYGTVQLEDFDFAQKRAWLTATAKSGSTFSHWELAPGDDSGDNPVSLVLKGEVVASPVFTPPSGVVAVKGIKIGGSARLSVGEEKAFTAKVTPTGYTTKNTVTWQSDEPGVLKVSDAGVATALSPGTATVTATIIDGDNGGAVHTDSFNVTVREAEAIDIGIEVLAVSTGKTLVLPILTGYKGTWATDDPGIARVNAGQKRVVAVKAGETKLTFTVESAASSKAIKLNDRKLSAGDTYTIRFHVRKPGQLPKSVSVDKKKLTLDPLVNTSAKLIATVKPGKALDKEVFFTSNKPGVATVDQQGNVTAVAPGTCKITVVSANLKRQTVSVTVTGAVKKVTLNVKKITLKVEDKFLLTAKVNEDALNKTIVWTSAKPGVATVDEDGVVTAIKKGKVKITATASNGKKAVVTVTVK